MLHFLIELTNKILLVLDNFETISESEKEEIIQFFEVEVKYTLKRNPENFKVIITSRQQIPCGFHQVSLSGLDIKPSKQLMTSLYKQYRGGSPELEEDQKEKIHQVTAGIPIIIKHCIGQIYEYNKPLDSVLNKLSSAEANRAVEFSFDELFKLLKSDVCQLEIVLLLELVNWPLMTRQITEILKRNESEIEGKIPSLVNYQCIKRVNQSGEEKYLINDELRIFTRRLIKENEILALNIKEKITRNFTIEKQMDYTTDEMGILGIFQDFLAQRQYLEAEKFIKEQLRKNPQSILLKYHQAKYFKEQKRAIEEAIKILESIREKGNNHPSILRLLISCYTSLDIPNYAQANVYVQQIETNAFDDESLKLEIAEFYMRWSISIKMKRAVSPDPIEEMLRQQKYKELAGKALQWLNQISSKTHQVYYMFAQSYFNKWDYENASEMIEKAISLCNADPRFESNYAYLQRLILRQKDKFSEHKMVHM